MSEKIVPLTIDRLSYGPAGVGRSDGKVVFVPGTVPGDEVDVVIDEEKKNYARGHVAALTVPSPYRRTPPCPYVTQCGGCPWQHITYAEQLRAKEATVREQLQRIGGIADPPVLPILAAPSEWHYRHRIRVRVENNTRLGFSPPQSHAVVEIESCLIAGETSDLQLKAARAWVTRLRTPLHHVEIIEHGQAKGEVSCVLIGEADGLFQHADDATGTQFLRTHPVVSGLMLSGQGWRRTWGDPSATYDLGVDSLSLTVNRGTFTQVNPRGNQTLIATLLQLGHFCKEQRVIELYCGAGNLSLPIAHRVASLIGIESAFDAVADARTNATRVGVTNAQFVHAAAHAGVQQLLQKNTSCDVIVLDPPRTGAAEVITVLPRFAARTICYVSCDPTTLARDIRQLQQRGYRLHVAQPIDLFPQTYHVETIAVCVLT
ncbi:MAG: 23S rRNA (uracil(1939)-C(5))-methyltransferase RlmD [Deltaproteobacteria bacterium]|nr:23S rRNA (uracil(1939)-C(5))-methyltransferase RlmD [Deltaproteobacteria bacterium]